MTCFRSGYTAVCPWCYQRLPVIFGPGHLPILPSHSYKCAGALVECPKSNKKAEEGTEAPE